MLGLIANNVYSSVDPATGQTRAGYRRADETHDIVSAIHTLYPNFQGQRKAVFSTIDAALALGYQQSAAAASESAANPDLSAQAAGLTGGGRHDFAGQNPDSVQAGIETGGQVTTTTPVQDQQDAVQATQAKVQAYSANYWSTHKDSPAARAKLEADPTYKRLLAAYQAALDAANPF
jgi:hypothetical protein